MAIEIMALSSKDPTKPKLIGKTTISLAKSIAADLLAAASGLLQPPQDSAEHRHVTIRRGPPWSTRNDPLLFRKNRVIGIIRDGYHHMGE